MNPGDLVMDRGIAKVVGYQPCGNVVVKTLGSENCKSIPPRSVQKINLGDLIVDGAGQWIGWIFNVSHDGILYRPLVLGNKVPICFVSHQAFRDKVRGIQE